MAHPESSARAGRLRVALARGTALATAGAVFASQTSPAFAAPRDPSVQAGQATVSTTGTHTRVDQTSRDAIVNWDSFGIGRDESVRFTMPGAGSSILNRVTGSDASHLMGRLSANGTVYLINRNGVVIGPDAVIDTNGFTASTLDMADQDFLAGRRDFLGDGKAGVVNHGTIRAAGGDILLIGHTVENTGTLQAPEGRVALGAGSDLRYVPGDGGGLQIRAGLGVETATGIDNSGLIEAATAELKAAGGNVYDLAVNQEGVVRASGVRRQDGIIILTAEGGAVRNAGTLRATRGDDGGDVRMGGGVQGTEANITNASTATVTAEGVVDVSAAGPTGDGGTAVVWADGATSFSGTLAARGGSAGGDGGFAEVSGARNLAFRPASVDLTAPRGQTGQLLLDPGDIDIQRDARANDSQSGSTFGNADAGVDTILNAADIETALAGANVTVQSADQTSITLSADLAWAAPTALTFDSGQSITLNGSVTAAAGTLVLQPSYDTANVAGTITQGAGSTLTLDTLRLKGDPTRRAGQATFNGVLAVGTLDVDANGGGLTSVSATNAGNTISTLTSTMGGLSVRDSAGGLDLLIDSTSATGGLDVRTVGDLTLLAGTNATWMPEPIVVTLEAKNGAFINRAGSDPFNLDATNHQALRVYTSDLNRTNPGGISATAVYGHDITSRPPFGPELNTAVSYIVYETGTAPTLVVVADDLSRVYGDANPALTWTVTGLADGETLADVVSGGTPALSTSATVLSNVGTYAIGNDGTGLTSTKYQLLFQDGVLTVTPAPLSLTVADNSRTYGSASLDRANSATATGLRNGQTVADLNLTYSYNQDLSRGATNNGQPTPISAVLGNANYSIATEFKGALTINRAPLTGTLSGAVSRHYGDTVAGTTLLTNHVTWTGLKNGETAPTVLSATTDDDPTRTVGDYALSLTGVTAANYDVTFSGTAALAVTKAPLTGILGGTVSRQYGDTVSSTDVLDRNVTWTGLKNGETGSTALSATTDDDPTRAVGDYALSLTGVTATNYDVTLGGTAALAVTKAPLTGTLGGAVSRQYGDTVAGTTLLTDHVTWTGLKNGETAPTVLSATTDDDPTRAVGDYALSLTGATAANYDITFGGATALAVTKAPLTGILRGTVSREYGDTVSSTDLLDRNVTWTGLKNGETGSTALSATTDDDPTRAVGNYALSLTGVTATNYDVTLGGTAALAVTKAPLTGTLGGTVNRQYGDTVAGTTLLTDHVTWTGLKNGETAPTALSATTDDDPTRTVGNYALSLTGVTAANYDVTFSGTAALAVTKAPLTGILRGTVSREYGDTVSGADLLDSNVTWTGLKNGETGSTALSAATDDDPTRAVGNYALSLTGVTAANYDVTLGGTAALAVTKAPLTGILRGAVSREYGDTVSGADLLDSNVTWTGLKNGETGSTALSATTDDDPTRAVGDYALSLTGVTAANYDVTFSGTAALAVTKAPLTGILGGTVSREYGDAVSGADLLNSNVTWTGLKNGETGITALSARTDDDPTRFVGEYTLSLSGVTAANYDVTLGGTAALIVTKAPLTVTADDVTTTFGSGIITSARVENLKLGHTVLDTVRVRVDVDKGTGTWGPGTYPLTVTATLRDKDIASNYSIGATNGGTLTLLPKDPEPVITIVPQKTTFTIPVIDVPTDSIFNTQRPSGSSIVVITPPEDPAGTSERQAIQGEAGQTALSDATEKLKENWPKDQPMDNKTENYVDSILDGSYSLDQVLNDAAAGDATARTVMAAVMPTLVSALAQKDPASLSRQEKALLDKVQNRIEERRAALVAKVEAKLEAYWAAKKQDASRMPLTRLVMTKDFPDVLQQAMDEVNADIIKSAATAAGGAAAGAAAAGATVALAATIFPFAGASAAAQVAGVTAASVAAGAAAPVALTIGLSVAIGAAGIIKLIKSGENEAAYNAFIAHNSQPVTSLAALAGGNEQAQAELALASSQIYMEMFGG